MSVVITINAIDKTKSVEFDSLRIVDNLTRKKDSCNFKIKSYSGDPYTPVLGHEVIITDGGVKVFAGVITDIENTAKSFKIIKWVIRCQDYTRLFDRKLVPDTFENTTIDAIIASLKTDYFPAGFTINNVNAPVPINYVAFNYKPISNCLEVLAESSGYDWYIDFDKDLHFFKSEDILAPFNLTDDDGSYRYNSLFIRKDNSQVRNVIVVRGGEYLGDTLTSDIECNGVDFIFPLPYKFSNFRATLTGQELDVGIDFLNSPDDHDVLHGFQEKILRFKELDTPSNGATIKAIGSPNIPVIVKLKSQEDINAMVSSEGGSGEYEHLIIDNSIKTKEGARERALAELQIYASTISEGEFETETAGLFPGQQITINSTSRGINQSFIINKVTITQFSSNTLLYSISLVSTKTFDLVDLLKRLLLAETSKISINPDEVIDLIEGASEEMTLSDEVETSISHNAQPETISLGEAFTAQSLDYEVEWVLGPFIPSGTKRVFLCGSGRLA